MLLRELLASTPIYEMIGYRKVDIKGWLLIRMT